MTLSTFGVRLSQNDLVNMPTHSRSYQPAVKLKIDSSYTMNSCIACSYHQTYTACYSVTML